eukprot:TRINITY_DN62394_c0_g1_i1.p1 TRINITY_DN62394_c0_g1~~TRINITY_DN62394_c0_g1_i1.p1  ORF type:complete len:321 (-),score=53.05 TRINITY_DN62394_c0_g1_i1:111-1073(-)
MTAVGAPLIQHTTRLLSGRVARVGGGSGVAASSAMATVAAAPATEVLEAARALRGATALLVTAGAGIGVDSGLPDFRGDEGLWRAYPPLRSRRLGFTDMADPSWFESEPNFAWGFYGHRLNLYRRTQPHVGFTRLLQWGSDCQYGVRVFTSNVDGQFQKAGFLAEHVCECHGSIHWLQTLNGRRVWPADDVKLPEVDAEVLSVPDDALPRCPKTGELARPNILMFGDWGWNGHRTETQRANLSAWFKKVELERMVVIELGAGLAVPTVRLFGERAAARGATLVRINPRDAMVPADLQGRAFSLPYGALEGLNLLADALSK